MAADTEKPNGGVGLTGIGRNIFRSNHRCLSPMAQLKISPQSSINGALSSDLPSPTDEISTTKMEAFALARDYIKYKVQPKPEDPINEAARTLRRVGDELIDRHQTVVNAMSKRLQYSNPQDSEQFAEYSLHQRMFLMIAREICQDGQDNWGRIVTLYVLGSILALNNMEHEGGTDIEDITNFVGEYVGSRKRKWIEKNGGWDGFVKFFDNGASTEKKVWKGLLYAVGLGALATTLVGSVGRQ